MPGCALPSRQGGLVAALLLVAALAVGLRLGLAFLGVLVLYYGVLRYKPRVLATSR